MEGHSLIEAEKEFHIGKQNIQKWRDAYELHGVKGILIKQNNHNKYTGDFKVHVIEYKQMHQLSARQTAAHFNIPTWQSVLNWEKLYKQEGPDALRRERRGKAGYESGTMKGCRNCPQYILLLLKKSEITRQIFKGKRRNSGYFQRESRKIWLSAYYNGTEKSRLQDQS